MRYNDVQTSLESYMKTMWTTPPLSFENHPFNSDLYDSYVQVNVVFGDAYQRSITNCYRVIGLLILTIHVRPAIGVSEALIIADQLSTLLVSKEISAVLPNTAPVVQMKTPDLNKRPKEENGWVKMQLSCPFHYDLEV